ncbi:hypothetical protein MF408_08790 [Nocardioides sp. TF02-7]|nr:hypothetical protein [Nocardioides sp. TF02-7]UMG95007.1 hypothetical protein MF408_08790 [Nocardioides sp. TF02-7]
MAGLRPEEAGSHRGADAVGADEQVALEGGAVVEEGHSSSAVFLQGDDPTVSALDVGACRAEQLDEVGAGDDAPVSVTLDGRRRSRGGEEGSRS